MEHPVYIYTIWHKCKHVKEYWSDTPWTDYKIRRVSNTRCPGHPERRVED